MPNYKIIIEYDGTEFSGWQIQPNMRTIQGELESAISKINGNKQVKINGAGRTDTGVHAWGQVASFCLDKKWEEKKLCNAINGNSADDINVKGCDIVGENFHARYSAIKRMYKYNCFLGKSPIYRKYNWEIKKPLSFEKLHQCAELLIGDLDFTSFAKHIPDKNNQRCIVNQSQWINNGSFVIFTIEANRFLQHLVRCLVGTMVLVGTGQLTVNNFSAILEEKNIKAKVYRAPSNGLFLQNVTY
ncbi:MAG: tRNA pseudouridine(38-40) synthase TruA [Candidatus Marinimicrobia bacterium]|nr:tRNA pseudouridine(38-40) synthase TruA [Candidatus Neomarinimicrobiota bacterium]